MKKIWEWHRQTSKWNWLKHLILFGIEYVIVLVLFFWISTKYPQRNITSEVSTLFSFFITLFSAIGLEYYQKNTNTGDWSLSDILWGLVIPISITVLIFCF